MVPNPIEQRLKVLGDRLANVIPGSLKLVDKTQARQQIDGVIKDLKEIEAEL